MTADGYYWMNKFDDLKIEHAELKGHFATQQHLIDLLRKEESHYKKKYRELKDHYESNVVNVKTRRFD